LSVTGSVDGCVFLWDYATHVQVGELGGHKTDITALVFLDPYPIVASADNLGNICFWVVRPVVLQVGKCVLRMMNTAKMKRGGSSEHLPVPALAFWESEGEARLYGADVSGVIKVWDLTHALQRWGFAPFRPYVDQGKRVSMSTRMHNRVNAYKDYRQTHKEVVESLEQSALKRTNILQPGDVKLIKWWPAHTEAIRDLRLISDPPGVGVALVSCSFDKKVAFWDRHGNIIGSLQQGNTKEARRQESHPKTPSWVFCSDMEGRQKATQDNAHKLLEELAVLHKNDQLKKDIKEREQRSKKIQDRQRKKNAKLLIKVAPAAARDSSTFLTEAQEPQEAIV
jgi:WD40 repeat protein